MKKIKSVLSAFTIGILLAQVAQADSSYKTFGGAVFKRVVHGKLGKAWEDPSGQIWSSTQGEFSNNEKRYFNQGKHHVESAAIDACAKIGGELPTAGDYTHLASYFEKDVDGTLETCGTPETACFSIQGQKDFDSIFSDTKDHQFWTSSVVDFDMGYYGAGITFVPHGGYIDNFSMWDNDAAFSVQCVVGHRGAPNEDRDQSGGY